MVEGVTFRGLRILSLLFAYDVIRVTFNSHWNSLQPSVKQILAYKESQNSTKVLHFPSKMLLCKRGLSLRLRSSAANRWITHSGLGKKEWEIDKLMGPRLQQC